MEKFLWCKWQLLLSGVLALMCLSCQPRMPTAPRPSLPPPPPAATPQPPPPREILYVKVGRLNLRAGPGMDFPKLGLLDRNEEVEQVGEAQNWFQVRVKKDGSLGWVASEYLSKTPVTSPIETPAPGPPPAPAVKETPSPGEPTRPKPSKVETTVPRAPKPAEAAEPPAPKAKPAGEPAPTPSPEPKAKPEKPAPKKEEPSVPPTPAPLEERPSGSGIRIM